MPSSSNQNPDAAPPQKHGHVLPFFGARVAMRPQTIVLRTITVLSVALSGFYFEDFKSWLPWLAELQTRSYYWVSRLGVRKPRPQWVIGVEFDDSTFYDYLGLQGEDAADRKALANVIVRATAADAAVIALDMNLSPGQSDFSEPRKSENQKLLASIREAEHKHIPVVLTFGFVDRFSPNRHPSTNVFPNEELPDFGNEAVPYRARVGFDEGPADVRAVPLVVTAKGDRGQEVPYSSFSLQIVDSYETTFGIAPRTKDILNKQISKRQFVYTSFLAQEKFSKVSVADVLKGDDKTLQLLRHRIVIIGGNRHLSKGSTEWRDSSSLGPLELRGMYFHANYVEGLLDNRISTLLPRWATFFLDLILGWLMVHYSGRAKGLVRRLGIVGVFFIPVSLAYIASVNLGYVLDFVLPLLLLFIHVFVEHYLDLRSAARSRKEVS